MLTFLIPVKPLAHTKKKETLIDLLSSTVESCLAVDKSRVIIVCDPSTYGDVFGLVSNKPMVNVLPVPETGKPYGDEDKGVKLFAGCKYWLKHYAQTEDHLMPLDCDDIVHKDINQVPRPGRCHVFEFGYLKIWNRLYPQPRFWYRNGSSHILSRQYVQAEVEAGCGKMFLYHLNINRKAAGFAYVYQPHVIQRIWHGENNYYTKRMPLLKTVLKYLFMSEELDRSVFVF